MAQESEKGLMDMWELFSSTQDRDIALNKHKKIQVWKLSSGASDPATIESICRSLSKFGLGRNESRFICILPGLEFIEPDKFQKFSQFAERKRIRYLENWKRKG